MSLARGNQPQPSISPANVQAAEIGLPPVERSVFNRPTTHTTTIDAGKLYPLYIEEALPGDVWRASLDIFVRVMTLLRPIMSNLHVDVFAFFTPDRIVWKNWVKLQGEQDSPGDSTDFLVPHIYDQGLPYLNFQSGSIYDYMGLPIDQPIHQSGSAFNLFVNALPFRAYNLIYNTWFRDQDFQVPAPQHNDDGPDPVDDYTLLYRNKRQDALTTVRPWPQKGPAVTIPISVDEAPVVGNDKVINLVRGASGSGALNLGTLSGQPTVRFGDGASSSNAGSAHTSFNPSNTVMVGLHQSPLYSGMIADLTLATATSINTIRDAVVLQQMLELDARGGTRYIESLFSRWRVKVQDDRLQRPEYIGGFSQMLDISAVPQTSQPNDETGNPMGQLAGYGTGGKVGHHMSYSVPEHGWIMILVNIRADLTYSGLLDRKWIKRTRWDYPEPLTMHIGEVPVMAYEAAYENSASMNTVFGYQEAWFDYRYSRNYVSGLMRPEATSSLANWNLAISPDDVPYEMDDLFLRDTPPISRVIAVPSQPAFLVDMTTKAKWARAMPVYSTPGLLRF